MKTMLFALMLIPAVAFAGTPSQFQQALIDQLGASINQATTGEPANDYLEKQKLERDRQEYIRQMQIRNNLFQQQIESQKYQINEEPTHHSSYCWQSGNSIFCN